MTARVLPIEEWDRLDESLDPILMNLSPSTARVCVVEDQGEIVARWLLFPVLHAECIWIAPHKRKTGRVAAHLLKLMRQSARALGFDRVWTNSDREDVTRLVEKLGAQIVPGLPVILPVGKD